MHCKRPVPELKMTLKLSLKSLRWNSRKELRRKKLRSRTWKHKWQQPNAAGGQLSLLWVFTASCKVRQRQTLPKSKHNLPLN